MHCLNGGTATRLYYVSLLFGSAIPTSLLTLLKSYLHLFLTVDCQQHCKYGGRARAQDLGNYITHNVTWYSTTVANICTVLETPAFTKLNRNGTNILVVKGTEHTRLKEIHVKATAIVLASFDVGHLKKSLKEDEEEEEERWTNVRFSRFLAVSLAMRFSHLGGIIR